MSLSDRLCRGLLVSALALGAGSFPVPGPASPASAAAPPADDERGRMMLVMDSSGSMQEPAGGGGTKIDAAKDALTSVIGDLPGNAPVGLRVYGAEVEFRGQPGACTDSQRVVDVGVDNRDDLLAAVRSYRPFGETPTGYALQQAGEDLGSEGPRTIVLVSDGEPTCRPDPCKVAADLAEDGIDLRIDVVGLDVSGEAREALSCIADKGNGTYYDADDADALADALATVAERAARPYEPIGTPISGGPAANAATPIEAGDWLDSIGPAGSTRGELWYRFERTVPGSTVHLSATIANSSGEDALHVDVFAGSTECGSGEDVAPSTYQPFVVAALASPGSRDYDEECTRADELTVKVGRGTADGAGDGRDTEPVELRLIEEPPAANGQRLPELEEPTSPAPPPTTNPKRIVGGNTFGNAVTIEPGTYSGNIVPGEAQIFEVEADWGQYVNAAVRFPPPSEPLLDALEDTDTLATLWLHSPSRANASSSFYGRQETPLDQTSGSELTGHTYPISYPNRTSFVDPEEAASIAGKYYVVVAADDEDDRAPSVEIPFTLSAAVEGEPRAEPVYDDGEPNTEPAGEVDVTGGDADGAAPAETGASAERDGGGSEASWLTFGLGAGAVALLGLGVLMIWFARRLTAG